MYPSAFLIGVLLSTIIGGVTAAATGTVTLASRADGPMGQVEPGTVANCISWFENKDNSTNCRLIPSIAQIDPKLFYSWNPTLDENCLNYKPRYAYCVKIGPPQPTTTANPTPTSPNGIVTPTPTLPAMDPNCYQFHNVSVGETCTDIADKYLIRITDFYTWNQYIGNNCKYLPTKTMVCVGAFTSLPKIQHYGCYDEAYLYNPFPGSYSDPKSLTKFNKTEHFSLTIEWCTAFCMYQNKQPLFGVEILASCSCGSELTMGTVKVADSKCDLFCAGNLNQACGGVNSFNLYGLQGVPPPLAYRSVGCYLEGIDERALDVASKRSDDMTIEKCANYCLKQFKTSLFNLQNKNECWCGNTLGKGVVPVASKFCNSPCRGNPNQMCGGPDILSLFSTVSTPPPLKFSRRGCYTEQPQPDKSALISDTRLNIKDGMPLYACARYCVSSGYALFGVQNGIECSCGNAINSASSLTSDSDCPKKCVDESDIRCGGENKVSIFEWK